MSIINDFKNFFKKPMANDFKMSFTADELSALFKKSYLHEKTMNMESINILSDYTWNICREIHDEYLRTSEINTHACFEFFFFIIYILNLVLDYKKYEFEKSMPLVIRFLKRGHQKSGLNEDWKLIAVIHQQRMQLYEEALIKRDKGQLNEMTIKIIINLINFACANSQFMTPDKFTNNIKLPERDILFKKGPIIAKYFSRMFALFSYLCEETNNAFEIRAEHEIHPIFQRAFKKDEAVKHLLDKQKL